MKISLLKSIIKEEIKNSLIGGKGDKLSSNQVNQKEFIVGKIVELEHTNDEDLAEEIVLDHLSEDPKYYFKLYNSDLIDEPKALKLARKFWNK